jgi:hypothetical protein
MVENSVVSHPGSHAPGREVVPDPCEHGIETIDPPRANDHPDVIEHYRGGMDHLHGILICHQFLLHSIFLWNDYAVQV